MRNTKDHWDVSKDRIQLEGEIGHGNFGKVYKGLSSNNLHICCTELVTNFFKELVQIIKNID